MGERDNEGEAIVMNYLKRKGQHPEKAEGYPGYDIKAGQKCIEVKSTNISVKDKHFFMLTEREYKAAMHNKEYWVYWVDLTKRKKIIAKINREFIKKYSDPVLSYRLKVSAIKRILNIKQ